jgi:hypothetical protein
MSLGTSTAHSFSLKTGNARALTINTSQNATFAGNVGVGGVLPLSNGGSGATVLGVHDGVGSGWSITKYTNTTTGTAAADGSIFGIIGSDAYVYNYETNGSVIFGTASSERMRITSTGNVGIGTTAPSQKLHISGNMRLTGAFRDGLNSQGAANYVLTSTGSNGTRWVDASGSSIIGGPYLPLSAGGTKPLTGDLYINSSLYFGGANERIYMNGGGATNWRGVEVNSSGLWSWGETGIGNYFSRNVGIGTTSPSQALEVHSTIKIGESGVAGGKLISADSMIFQIDSDNNSTTSSYRFRTNGTADDGTELMRIQENG